MKSALSERSAPLGLLSDKVTLKGEYTFRIRRQLELTIKGHKYKVGYVEHNGERIYGRALRTYKYVNLVPTVMRTMIANNLTSASPTNVMKITHGALGSSATAPANSDTQLGTEVYRNAIASLTNASNIAYATAFYSAAETSGTYAEAGIFCNGTGTVNSGILGSHVSISITKSTSVTLTLDWALTIS